MNMIFSADKNWAIGNKGKMLAYLPKDLAHFKKITLGKVIVMGRKTYESLPKKAPLSNRINIILTKNKDLKVEGFIVLHEIEELKEYIKDMAADDIFIIGGETLYRYFKDHSKYAYVTKIDNVFEADTFAPDLDKEKDWHVVEKSICTNDNGNDICFIKYMNDNVIEL